MEVENKVKPKQKGKGNKKTAEVNTDNSNTADNSTSERRKSLTVEEKYQKLDPREHVLKRPDMYSSVCAAFNICSWKRGQGDSGDVGV